jgi:hypothetical protein
MISVLPSQGQVIPVAADESVVHFPILTAVNPAEIAAGGSQLLTDFDSEELQNMKTLIIAANEASTTTGNREIVLRGSKSITRGEAGLGSLTTFCVTFKNS